MKLQLYISKSISSAVILCAVISNAGGQTASVNEGLFDLNDTFTITLKGNTRELLNDREGVSTNFPFTLSYYKDSVFSSMPVELRTRGHFRRMKENCTYPPLMIEFPPAGAHLSTVFKDQKKLKLVMPCKGDEYTIREWLVYKLYNLITTYSFRARLVTIKLEDINNRKTRSAFYGLLLEEENQMAKRNKAIAVERKITPQQARLKEFLTMSVFQYLAGNTDWSIQYQQNIKLLVEESNDTAIPVPYDFDHAGIVNTTYAMPAEELKMSSIRQRRYRGYCINDLAVFNEVIAKFNDLKNEMYAVYKDCPLLNAKYLKSTLQYLDEFYATINNTKAWQQDFAYPCDKNGTGNIVIKGLKED